MKYVIEYKDGSVLVNMEDLKISLEEAAAPICYCLMTCDNYDLSSTVYKTFKEMALKDNLQEAFNDIVYCNDKDVENGKATDCSFSIESFYNDEKIEVYLGYENFAMNKVHMLYAAICMAHTVRERISNDEYMYLLDLIEKMYHQNINHISDERKLI